MAEKKQPDPDAGAIKPNRAQRRRDKFGRAGGEAKDLWPQREANPAFAHVDPASEDHEATGDQAAHAGRPDQDVTHDTGPGSGGATESADKAGARKRSPSARSPKG